jgi:hypothetical protein
MERISGSSDKVLLGQIIGCYGTVNAFSPPIQCRQQQKERKQTGSVAPPCVLRSTQGDATDIV